MNCEICARPARRRFLRRSGAICPGAKFRLPGICIYLPAAAVASISPRVMINMEILLTKVEISGPESECVRIEMSVLFRSFSGLAWRHKTELANEIEERLLQNNKQFLSLDSGNLERFRNQSLAGGRFA